MQQLFPTIVQSPSAMKSLGMKVSKHLQAGDIVALIGDLGAGKTHLTQGIAEGLGRTDSITSPTFSLVNEYPECRPELIHFDWYRLDTPEELLSIGWEDYLERDAILVVEWPDRFPEMVPAGSHCLHIEHLESGRSITYQRA
ncbi:tRNA (adenosine(37)-N6)-threonylcarbamoyltransferase complex ATPase subunit type 1 TsaE [Rubritalea marina]|uniref:tRNA (adenosine(37)-N6)-threonylcarbamoyltransferase complex ATPase subunit type 1 TsaE n=1 Tax=Rubritalea marina TaxID=361055 RepID=UPI00036EE7D2|nr:tRNA (adenosine(37)-N6)-threonylcarbamoyltransferase complex ATPase subunit type 1 TsaE [Rubritalea marina]